MVIFKAHNKISRQWAKDEEKMSVGRSVGKTFLFFPVYKLKKIIGNAKRRYFLALALNELVNSIQVLVTSFLHFVATSRGC